MTAPPVIDPIQFLAALAVCGLTSAALGIVAAAALSWRRRVAAHLVRPSAAGR